MSSRPPVECQGYPPPLLPKLAASFFDVDFYIGAAGEEKGAYNSEEPRLACTLTWCKDVGLDGAGDIAPPSVSVVEDPTIQDVQHTMQSIDARHKKPVVIICHGFSAWRNQMLISHVAAGLAQRLNCHALRFDFRGNGHSGGKWRSAGFDEELCDLRRVVGFVRNELGCEVLCVAGHSKGSKAALRFAFEQENGEHQELHAERASSNIIVPYFVNLAGRFATPGEIDITKRFSEEQCDELAKEGKFKMKTLGGKEVVVTQEDIDEMANASSAFVSEIRTASVLTVHGSADIYVDAGNAKRYDECISKHTLKIIEGADHNFNGLKYVDEIVSAIAEFTSASIPAPPYM